MSGHLSTNNILKNHFSKEFRAECFLLYFTVCDILRDVQHVIYKVNLASKSTKLSAFQSCFWIIDR